MYVEILWHDEAQGKQISIVSSETMRHVDGCEVYYYEEQQRKI